MSNDVKLQFVAVERDTGTAIPERIQQCGIENDGGWNMEEHGGTWRNAGTNDETERDMIFNGSYRSKKRLTLVNSLTLSKTWTTTSAHGQS